MLTLTFLLTPNSPPRRIQNQIALAALAAVMLVGCHSTAPTARDVDAAVPSIELGSLDGSFRITPVGFIRPAVELPSGWPIRKTLGSQAADAQLPDAPLEPTMLRVHLLIAVFGPWRGAQRLARTLRQESLHGEILSISDASSQQVTLHCEGGLPLDLAGGMMYVDAPGDRSVDAQTDSWESTPVANGVGVSVAVIRINVVGGPDKNHQYVVTLEPLLRALPATWEKLPVVIDVRPIELNLREP